MKSRSVTHVFGVASRFVTAFAVALMLVVGGSTVSGHAADSYDTQGYVTGADFTETSVESWGRAELNLTWAMPNNPTGDTGMIINLPDGLRGVNTTFDIFDTDGEIVIGHAIISHGQVNVDFDEDYFVQHPVNISGTLSLWVEFTLGYDDLVDETFNFGQEVIASIVIDGRPVDCGEYCVFEGTEGYKQGSADIENNALRWDIVVPAPAEGLAEGQLITVTDHLGPNQKGSSYIVRKTNEFTTYDDGYVAPGKWVDMQDDEFTFDLDSYTWSWTAEDGYFYVISAVTRPTDGWASETYRNDATITVEGWDRVTVGAEVTSLGGGGVGGGDRENPVLTLIKNVEGGTAQSTEWLLQAEPRDVSGQSVVVGPGGVDRVQVLPGDYVLSESGDGPADYVAGEWSCTGAEFDGSTSTLSLQSGDEAICQITNTYEPRFGSLIWSKVAAGSGGLLAGSQWELTGPDGSVILIVDNTGQHDYEGLDADSRPGEFLVEGVEIGAWELRESKAPLGFVKSQETFTMAVLGGETADFGDIENHPVPAMAMPAAGSVGILGLWIGGSLLLAGAFALERRKRLSAQE